MNDVIRKGVACALGDLCVPFSTEEEYERGLNFLAKFFLESTKALLEKNKDTSVSPGVLIQDIFVSLRDAGCLSSLVERINLIVKDIEAYKVSSGFEKKAIYARLSSYGLI